MHGRYLEVTYRHGKPLAAYLYLPRDENAKSVRVVQEQSGLLVDLGEDGRPIGIEILCRAKPPCIRSTRYLASMLCHRWIVRRSRRWRSSDKELSFVRGNEGDTEAQAAVMASGLIPQRYPDQQRRGASSQLSPQFTWSDP